MKGGVGSHELLISAALALAYSQGSCGHLLNASLEGRRKGGQGCPRGTPALGHVPFQAVIPWEVLPEADCFLDCSEHHSYWGVAAPAVSYPQLSILLSSFSLYTSQTLQSWVRGPKSFPLL